MFNLGGMVTKYLRFYSVLPGMDKKEFDNHMDRVRKLARSLDPKQEEKNKLVGIMTEQEYLETFVKELQS